MRRAAALAGVVAAVALGACGGDDEPAGTTGATATAGPATTPTVAPAATTDTAPPTATTGVPKGGVTTGETTTSTSTSTDGGGASGESGEGGAGDEEPARVPVALTHRPGALSPTTVTVPAFLSLEIAIAGPSTVATLPGGTTLAIPGSKTIPGLKPGTYAITTPDGGRTTLQVVKGGDPGP